MPRISDQASKLNRMAHKARLRGSAIASPRPKLRLARTFVPGLAGGDAVGICRDGRTSSIWDCSLLLMGRWSQKFLNAARVRGQEGEAIPC